MAFNRKFNRNRTEKVVSCSCGGKAKFRNRKNYTHGKKSKPTSVKYYKCTSCKKVTYIQKDNGGRK